MAKKLTLPDYVVPTLSESTSHNRNMSYEVLLDALNSVSKEEIEASIKKFEAEKILLSKAIKRSLDILKEQPLLSAFLIWSGGNYIQSGYPNYAKMLIEKDILQFKNDRGHLLIIKDLKEGTFTNFLESMRCRKDIDAWHKEILVLMLLDFVNWMKSLTGLSVFDICDRDKEKTSHRWLKHDDFIRFLGKLDDRCQLVAKLLYFGGSRTLAEVLNIQTKDIDFITNTICFGSQRISYPKHIMEDIKALAEGKGKIFVGRNKTSLNPATIFRNFKEASLSLGVEEVYSPKILTTDV